MAVLVVVYLCIALVVPVAASAVDVGPVAVDAGLLSLALLLALVPITVRMSKYREALDSPYLVPFLFFLAAGLASIFSAYQAVQSLQMWLRYLAYFSMVLLAPLVLTSLLRIKGILAAIALSGAIAAIYGFYMYIYHPEVIQVGAYSLDPTGETNRIAGTFPNANALGEYVILAIPAALGLVLTLGKWRQRIFFSAICMLLLVALLLSYSRGSWLALALGLTAFLLLVEKRLLFPLAAIGVIAAAMLPKIVDRLLTAFTFASNTASFRTRLWGIYLGEFKEHAISGVGLGNYLEAYNHFNYNNPITGIIAAPFSPHNLYLGTLVEAGVLGLIGLGLVLFTVIRVALIVNARSVRGSQERIVNAAILGALSASFFNGLTSSLYTHTRVFIVLWLMVALQAAVYSLVGSKQPGARREPASSSSSPVTSRILSSSVVYRFFTGAPRVPGVMRNSMFITLLASVQDRVLSALQTSIAHSASVKLFRSSPSRAQSPEPLG